MSTPDSAYDSQILKRLGNAALQNVEAMTIYVLSYGATRTVLFVFLSILTCRCVG